MRLGRSLQEFGAQFDFAFFRKGAHILADFSSCLTGSNTGEPRRIRRGFVALDDVNHFAVLEFTSKGRRFAINFTADCAIAEVSMNLISEINCC